MFFFRNDSSTDRSVILEISRTGVHAHSGVWLLVRMTFAICMHILPDVIPMNRIDNEDVDVSMCHEKKIRNSAPQKKRHCWNHERNNLTMFLILSSAVTY